MSFAMINVIWIYLTVSISLFFLTAFLVGVLKGYYFGNAYKKREKDGN